MDIPMQRPTAVITGSAGGIGNELALLMLKRGYDVVGVDRAPDSKVPARHENWTGLELDLNDAAAPAQIAKSIGSRKIDILVNNAGSVSDGSIYEIDDVAWNAMIANNLSIHWRVIKELLPHLRKPGASIVNVASVNAINGSAYRTGYAAAKGGLVSLTKSLARQLGPEGIRVNAVAPGAIATSIKRINGNTQENAVLGRTGRAVEVANAIYFFGSSDSSYITGQVLAVDGGRFA